MTRSTGWPLALASLMLLGCVGPFADTFDEAVQDTPADYDECCAGADRALLAKLAGTPVTVAAGGDLAGVRVDAVVTTRQFDDTTERGVTWGKDGDGLIAPDDTHDYVVALITRPPGADPKSRPVTTVTVFARPADAWRQACPSTSPDPSASAGPSAKPGSSTKPGQSAKPGSSAKPGQFPRPGPCDVPAVYESAPLVEPSDGSPVTSMIIAMRVPTGHTVLLTAGDPKQGGPAVDLRTGRAATFPARA